MTTIAQMRVPSTRKMSIIARRLFFRPNCNGVKSRLKIIFKINGKTTKKDNLLLKNSMKTFPNEKAMST